MAELKTKKTKQDPTLYLKTIVDEHKRADAEVLLKIFADATGLPPAMWGTSMIGYGSYHYKSERSTQEGDWPLTAFAVRTNSLTIYIMPGFSAYKELLAKLGTHKISGGSCIYIKQLSDIHIPTLKKIIKTSVAEMKKKYRVK
jgi:hypothetical protein